MNRYASMRGKGERRTNSTLLIDYYFIRGIYVV